MLKDNNRAAHALFKSVSSDQTNWLFIVLSDDAWKITRNGIQVATGTGERRSLSAGVEKFLSLTRTSGSPDAACTATVRAQLDRIEHATVKVASSHERIRPNAKKTASAYSTA